MNKPKNLVKIALVTLIFVILSLSVYFNKYSKTQEISTSIANQETASEINFFGEWKMASFPKSYRHSINIMLPATWKFDCCGDTDSFSIHSIYPPMANNSDANPSIHISDFVLISCPKNNPDCDMDQVQRVSPSQYLANKIKEFDSDPNFTKKNSVKLLNFSNNASVYDGYGLDNSPIELYLIQTTNGVVKIQFQQAHKFASTFKTEFLNKLRAN